MKGRPFHVVGQACGTAIARIGGWHVVVVPTDALVFLWTSGNMVVAGHSQLVFYYIWLA